jgi:hypothetical protein
LCWRVRRCRCGRSHPAPSTASRARPCAPRPLRQPGASPWQRATLEDLRISSIIDLSARRFARLRCFHPLPSRSFDTLNPTITPFIAEIVAQVHRPHVLPARRAAAPCRTLPVLVPADAYSCRRSRELSASAAFAWRCRGQCAGDPAAGLAHRTQARGARHRQHRVRTPGRASRSQGSTVLETPVNTAAAAPRPGSSRELPILAGDPIPRPFRCRAIALVQGSPFCGSPSSVAVSPCSSLPSDRVPELRTSAVHARAMPPSLA